MTEKKKCVYCNNTGYYGDNGPGIERNQEYMRCDMCKSYQDTAKPPAQNFTKTLNNFRYYLESVEERDPCAAWNGNSSGKLYMVDGEVLGKFLANIEQAFKEETKDIDYENVSVPDSSKKTIKGIFKMLPEINPLELSEEDQEKFADSIINPPEPAKALVEAFENHKECKSKKEEK